MSIVNSVNGNTSSKRVAGLVYLGVGLIMGVLDMVTELSITYDIFIAILITGTSLLGLGVLEYFPKKNQ